MAQQLEPPWKVVPVGAQANTWISGNLHHQLHQAKGIRQRYETARLLQHALIDTRPLEQNSGVKPLAFHKVHRLGNKAGMDHFSP